MNLVAFSLLASLLGLGTYVCHPELAPGAAVSAAAFTVSGGKFNNQRLTIASPTDVGKRPGAASGYWSQRPSVGTELDAKSERPLGLLLHVPAAGAKQAHLRFLPARLLITAAPSPTLRLPRVLSPSLPTAPALWARLRPAAATSILRRA